MRGAFPYVRPRVAIITKGLKASLKEHLLEKLAEGPLAESELWDASMDFFAPQLRGMSASLIRSYRLQFGRKLGRKTAEMNIIRNLRLLLSEIKKELHHTERVVTAGGKRFGRIFYAKGQEGRIQRKVRELVEGVPGRQKEVLEGVKSGPVRITPGNRRAVEMLEHYGLVEVRRMGGAEWAVEPGYSPVRVERSQGLGEFPSSFKVWRPFRIETWVLRDGPEKVKLKFDEAAWDPVNRVFWLAVKREYLGVRELRELRERAMLLGLPARLVAFCGEASRSAEKYAKAWGIDIRYKNSSGRGLGGAAKKDSREDGKE